MRIDKSRHNNKFSVIVDGHTDGNITIPDNINDQSVMTKHSGFAHTIGRNNPAAENGKLFWLIYHKNSAGMRIW